jgi:hypothetical protein
MKVLALVTHTPNCEPFWRSLEAIGHEVRPVQYDNLPHDRHSELVEQARGYHPDFMVYIGAYEPSHGRPVPSTATILKLREVAPLILICGDAADEPWWPVLEEYHQKECFNVMVAIDGSFETPIASFSEGITLLTPTDPRSFYPLLWDQRAIKLGMIGGTGHRGKLVNELQSRGLIDFRQGPVGRSYYDFAQLMCKTKLTLNCAETGTGKHLHVKGRVIEAGFAGSAVLEVRGSPLNKWFSPGEEYIEYDSLEDILNLNRDVPDFAIRAVAEKFHKKMVAEHSPHIFWNKVLTKAGIYGR